MYSTGLLCAEVLMAPTALKILVVLEYHSEVKEGKEMAHQDCDRGI
jgi:hypothetical protein